MDKIIDNFLRNDCAEIKINDNLKSECFEFPDEILHGKQQWLLHYDENKQNIILDLEKKD